MTILVLYAVCFFFHKQGSQIQRLFVLILNGGLVVFGKSGGISPRILCSKVRVRVV
jgi:hypothetical protein